MHSWGDGFKYFGEVGQAADEIGQFCRRWGRINVTCTKEKWGSARVYCSFGWSQLFSITHPGYVYSRYPEWLWSFDIRYLSRLISKFNFIVVPYQRLIYRLAYRRAIKKYPMIVREILGGADWDELLEDLWPTEVLWDMYREASEASGKWRDMHYRTRHRWEKLATAYRKLKTKKKKK